MILMRATKQRGAKANRSSREALAETWFDRATELLERVRDEATEEELEEALAQPTSVSGVSVLLSRLAEAASEFDALAPALLRGVREQERLLEEAGGGLSRAQVADLLGVSPPAVDQRRRRGQLLFVETLGGQFLYPACQFTEKGTLPHLADLLGWMGVDDGWMRLDMMLSPLSPLGNRTPIHVLAAGSSEADLEELRAILQSWGV